MADDSCLAEQEGTRLRVDPNGVATFLIERVTGGPGVALSVDTLERYAELARVYNTGYCARDRTST